ncbi:mitochondrial holo-[acyl-carrier-protein] synthase [Monosporozyma servazzii]
MIKGIGVDIVHLPRVFKLIDKYAGKRKTLQAIAGKVMCSKEQTHFYQLMNLWDNGSNERQKCTRYMAGIWATKEATYKCMSNFIPSQQMLPAQTIYTQLLYKNNNPLTGAPQVDLLTQLNPQYQKFYEKYLHDSKIMLSISHDGDYLISYSAIVSNVTDN